MLLAQNLRSFPGEMRNWAPDTQGKERPRKRQTTQDWWVAGLIRELMKLVLRDHKTSCSLLQPTRILSYTEAFTRFSIGLLQRVSTAHSSLKVESLKPAPAMGRIRHLHSTDRAGGRSRRLPSLRSCCGHRFWMIFSNSC